MRFPRALSRDAPVTRFLLAHALHVLALRVAAPLLRGARSVFHLGLLFGPAIHALPRGDGLPDRTAPPAPPPTARRPHRPYALSVITDPSVRSTRASFPTVA
ncbi:MAG: hypothetical protein U0414_40665 [Polyangiaceae bacterium]